MRVRDRSSEKARYHELRAAGRCVRCSGLLLPEWAHRVRCPECLEAQRASEAKHRRRGGQAKQREYRRQEHVRQSVNEKRRERVLRHKLAGLCLDCQEPCLEDCLYCARHRDMHRASGRDWARRKRLSEKTGRPVKKKKPGRQVLLTTRLVGKPTPLQPKKERMSDRVLRAAERFDTFNNEDIREVLGMSSNRASVELVRLMKMGQIVRLRGKHGSNDTTYTVASRRAA